ncbi:ATP-dependent RNA helicase [Bartonella clarridgeiae 73]|uniref:ATP-dependent RNA helicase n=1 Tax=Bartonella clarridgeiae (strain CCUG 45776 / CIP 104772 / 73) TaxID=696125 RepID=E6YIE6_BARC7|nr:DEAD/DEAH box helicase [Bartonella clarridgeiae]CBI76634.1 ATP-dependent RNA helicase [Bartonella clarridgeiae 73]
MSISKENVFAELGLSSLLIKNLFNAGMSKPKLIQAQAIPVMLKGHDVLGIAQTGSGKTLAFSLPILNRILTLGDKRHPKTARALILVPTRELAVQIEEAISAVAKGTHLSTCLILGGMSRLIQIKRMAKGVDILIATPGRLMDLIRSKYIDLSQSRFFVLDEADRMLDMGFISDVRQIANFLHKKCQTALFSATMPKEVNVLADNLLKKPIKIEVVPQGTTAVEITQVLYCVSTSEKKSVLSKLLTNPALASVIVFIRTKHGADSVARSLKKTGYSVATIHGNKSQNARQCALKDFREGLVRILVATDIVARGIDIPGISHVINYDLPDNAESYVHRIGRTGRNGASGDAITLFDEKVERARLSAIERLIRIKLTRKEIPPQFAALPEKLPEPKTHKREDNKERHLKRSKGWKKFK